MTATGSNLQPTIKSEDEKSSPDAVKDAALENVKERKKRWATKTKTGCDTCRIRRIKCDERKPKCKRCELGRRFCIGLFYGGTSPPSSLDDDQTSSSSAASRLNIRAKSFSNPNPNPNTKHSPPFIVPPIVYLGNQKHRVPPSPSNPPQFVGTVDIRDLIDLLPALARATHAVEQRSDWQEFIKARVRELTSYIFYLPSRSGTDPALDSAVRATASAFREFVQYKGDMPSLFRTRHKSVALYMQALAELQKALQNPVRCTSAEVLCATELLCIFECINGHSVDGTIQHARGAYRLIHHRGASRFDSPFDKSLFMNQLPLLAVQAFHQDQVCFLGQPSWQQFIKDTLPSTTGMEPADDYMLQFYLNSINMSNTCIQSTALILGTVPAEHIERRRQELLLECEDHTVTSQRWRLMLLRARPPMPTEDSDDDSFSKWQDLYDIYESSMLLLNRMYVALGVDQAELLEQQAQALAVNLLTIARARPQSSIRRPNTIFVEPMCLAMMNSAEPWAKYGADCTKKREAGEPTPLVPPDTYKVWTNLLNIQLSDHPNPNNGTTW